MKIAPSAVPGSEPTYFEEAPLVMSIKNKQATLVHNYESPTTYTTHRFIQVRPKCIFSIKGKPRICWDLFIIALALYNCIYLPFFVAFTPDRLWSGGIIAVNIIIDVIFFLDIMLNFRTSFINEHDREVFDSRMIWKQYIISGELFWDLVITIPFDFIVYGAGESGDKYCLLRCLKMIRIWRFSKVQLFVRAKEKVKLMYRLISLLIILLLIVHVMACFWFMIVDDDKVWVPPTDYLYMGYTDLYTTTVGKQYWFCFYHVLFLLVGIDIGGRGLTVYATVDVLYAAGAIVCAVMFGEIANVMTEMNKKAAIFAEVQDQVYTTMKNMQLPDELQVRIADFLFATYHILEKHEEYEKFIKVLPPSLRNEVNRTIYRPIFERNVLLIHSPSSLLEFILSKMENQFYQPDYPVVTQYSEAEEFYFIADGKCEIEVLDELKAAHKIRILGGGDHFGEIALLYNTERTATVKTTTYANLAALTKESFHDMIKNFPEAKEMLLQCASNYMDHWKVFLKTTMTNIPYLRCLSADKFDELIYTLGTKQFAANEYLFNYGERVDEIYVIVEGCVHVTITVKDKELHTIVNQEGKGQWESVKNIESGYKSHYAMVLVLDELKMGSIINSKLGLVGGEMLVSYRAVEPTKVLVLSSKKLDEIANNFTPLKAKLSKVRKNLHIFDSVKQDILTVQIGIDTIKCYRYDPSYSTSTKVLLRWKNQVLKILARKKSISKKGLPNIKSLVEKIKAIMIAEERGMHEIANKIACGDLAADTVKILDILNVDELENPLLTQFASKAKEIHMVFQFLGEQFKYYRERIEAFDKDCNNLQMSINEINSMLDTIIQLST